MVKAIASSMVSNRKVPPCIEFEDLVSWGVEGLIKAKRMYKGKKGSTFSTYAYYRIRGEIMDYIRREWKYRTPSSYDAQRKKVREKITEVAKTQLQKSNPKHSSIEEKLTHILECSSMAYVLSTHEVEVESDKTGTKNPETELIDENQTELWEEVKKLEENEQQIVEMFYIQGLKQVEIAAKLKLSKSKVCRLHMQLLDKLQLRLEERYKQS